MADVTVSTADVQALGRYQALGSPDELQQKLNKAARDAEKLTAKDAEIAALKAKVPADGALVLTGDEKTRAEALLELEGSADEIKAKLEKGTEAETKLAGFEWEKAARAAAKAAKKNEDALVALPGARELSFEVRTEKVDGKDVQRVYVKQGTDSKPLDDYIDGRDDWRPLKVALEAQAGTSGGGGNQGTGTAYPDQQGNQDRAPTNPLDDFISRRNQQRSQRPNPLAPPQAQPQPQVAATR